MFSHEAYAKPDAFLRSDMLRWLAESVASNLPEDWAKYVFVQNPDGTIQPSEA